LLESHTSLPPDGIRNDQARRFIIKGRLSMWSAQEHDAVLRRISDLGDAEDGTLGQREMWALAEKWHQEGGVPEGGCATVGDDTLRRALIILQALAWIEYRRKQQ
jgi:hypothetical protein